MVAGVTRGEIWWANLAEPRESEQGGSEPGYRRPVLIVQADIFNRSQIQTVIVAAITSNHRLADAPGNLLLPAKSSGLAKDSVVNVSQLLTLDRNCLTGHIATLSRRMLSTVEEGMRLVLEL